MAQLRNYVAILAIIIAAAVSLQCTEAKDHIVGGDTIGWASFPPSGASFYSKWAANITFKVNDTLVFKFESGSHSVSILSKANYDKCNVNENIQSYAVGPARVTLNRTGRFYFSCSFSGHCSSGQKLSVKVATGTSSSSPAPGKAPLAKGPSSSTPASGLAPTTSPSNEETPSSSTGPGATASPPNGSSTPVAATFCLLLSTIAFNILFHF